MQKINKEQLIEDLVAVFKTTRSESTGAVDEAALRRQLDHAIALALAKTQEVDSRRVTIVLSDLRGFTAVAEKYTALQMVEALNRYFGRMSEIIVRHGGTIDKFMGDAIMALFGAPISREDDLEAALACAIEMQIAMQDINNENIQHGMAPLYMGIGINTGEVVAGPIGSILHTEYTVIGDQVNLASRVEAHSLRGQILLSENTFALARDFIETGSVNEVKVKGKKNVVHMYELLATHKPQLLRAPAREIRNSHRVNADLPLRFYLIEHTSVSPQVQLGRVVDISYGGMYIISPVMIEPFTDILIELSMSALEVELTEIYAKVLRVSKVGELFECRLEFTSIAPAVAAIIKEHVDSLVELNRR
jgi:adenylate cyclase